MPNLPVTWAPIIEAVKEPITLAALVVLCLAMVGRLAIGKVTALRGSAAYRVTIYTVSVVAGLALFAVVGTITLKFYELEKRTSKNQLVLSRLDAENILQKHRGNRERCIGKLSLCLFLDFVFQGQAEAGLNVDVFAGSDAIVSGDVEFMHPRLKLPGMFGEFPGRQKLSVTFPDINRCIVDALRGDLQVYHLADGTSFAHRYITDWGAGQAALFRKYVNDERLITHDYRERPQRSK